jgi:hypothetical protein
MSLQDLIGDSAGASDDDVLSALMGGETDELPPIVGEDVDLDEDLEDELPPEVEDELPEPDEEDEDDLQPAGEDDEGDEDLEDHVQTDTDYLDVTDEDLIEVTIDGKVEFRTIGDAKKALSYEGAAAGRLKDATLMRQQAETVQREGMLELEAKREQFTAFVGQLDELLFQPSVSPPDESLRQSDPQAYLAQVDAKKADDARIATGRATLTQNIQNQNQQQADNFAAYQTREAQVLAEKLPILVDKEKGPEAQQHLLAAARHYGITPAEMAKIGDHRLFLIAYDGYKYAQLKQKAQSKGKTLVVNKDQRPARKLRSGIARTKLATVQATKTSKAQNARARETGKVDDVLATIFKPAK